MNARLKWLLTLVLLLDVGFIGWSCAVNQLHLSIETEGQTTVTVDDGVHVQELRQTPGVAETSLTLRASGQSFVPPLRTGHGASLSDPGEYSTSGFVVEGDLGAGGGFRSVDGGVISWRGRVAGLTVGLPCGAGRGTVCVSSPKTEICHDLGACLSFHEVQVPSATVTHAGLVPFWRTRLTLASREPVVVRRASVRFGTRTLFERERFLLNEPTALPFTDGPFSLLARLTGDALALLGQLFVLIVLMVLAGVCVATPVVERIGLIEALLLAFFVGQGLSANLATGLYYLLPTSSAWPLTVGVLLLLGTAQLRKGGWRRWQRSLTQTSREERRTAVVLTIIATVSCFVAAFPAISFRGWFVGQGYTDSVDYPTWASLAHEAAIDRGLGAIRFEDFVRLATTSHTLGVDTREALAPQMLVLWWVFPFLAWALLRRLRLPGPAALGGALVASHGFCFFEIATQCYLPHYEVTHFAVAGLWASLWFIDDEPLMPTGLGRRWAEGVLGAVFAAGVGLYPYHAFSVMGFAAAFVSVALARRQASAFWCAVRVGLFTAIICNVNLEVIFDFGKGSMQHRASLNAIGRNVVFPWFASREAPAILAGTEDFVRNSLHADAFAAELFAAMPKTGSRFAVVERAIRRLVWPTTIAVLLVAAASLIWLLSRRDRGSLVAIFTVVAPLAIAGRLMLSGDVYFWVKSLMTFSALMVVPFAGAAMGLAFAPSRLLASVGAAVTGAFVLVSLRTAWFDAAAYFLPRESAALAQARTHLPVTQDALWRFERWVDGLRPAQRFRLEGRLDDRLWTDGDWVTTNRVLQLLEGHSVWHGDDERRRYTRSRDVGYRGKRPLSDFDFVVTFGLCESPPDATLVLTTELFCVFAVRGR